MDPKNLPGNVSVAPSRLLVSGGLNDQITARQLTAQASQSSVLRRYEAPSNFERQQCAFKKSKAKGGKGGKKMSQLNARYLENFMPEHLDMVEVSSVAFSLHFVYY